MAVKARLEMIWDLEDSGHRRSKAHQGVPWVRTPKESPTQAKHQASHDNRERQRLGVHRKSPSMVKAPNASRRSRTPTNRRSRESIKEGVAATLRNKTTYPNQQICENNGQLGFPPRSQLIWPNQLGSQSTISRSKRSNFTSIKGQLLYWKKVRTISIYTHYCSQTIYWLKHRRWIAGPSLCFHWLAGDFWPKVASSNQVMPYGQNQVHHWFLIFLH